MIGNSNTTSLEVSAECKEQSTLNASSSNVNVARPPFNQPSRSFSHGPVAILWDIENCPVPSDVRPEDVGGNIRMALRVHPVIKGAVTMFSAYGDFNAFPRRLREGCQRTGVKLIDVPNGRKDAADKAILVDMFLFALDNPPSSSIMLISGDVDFAPALHILGQRGYTVILVIPSGVGVSSALCNAGRFVWDWPSVARGEGFVPPMKSMMPRVGLTEVAGYLMGCNINDNADGNEDEAIVYRGFSQNYYNSRDLAVMSQSLNEYNCSGAVAVPLFSTTTSRSHSLPSGINEITSNSAVSNDQNGMDWWVQPGDVNGLKAQLVRLLEFSGGCLPLARLPSEYQKLFGRPLCISDYGAFKLVYLLKKMSDALVVEGKGQKKMVCLRNSKHSPTTPSDPSKKDQKGKGPHKENACCGSSDEFSDDETTGKKPDMNTNVQREIQDPELERFKHELQEILVSYSCRIFIGCFEAIYQQRYKKILDFRRFGVNELEELFEKVRDVVALHEEPVSRRKFLTAILS